MLALLMRLRCLFEFCFQVDDDTSFLPLACWKGCVVSEAMPALSRVGCFGLTPARPVAGVLCASLQTTRVAGTLFQSSRHCSSRANGGVNGGTVNQDDGVHQPGLSSLSTAEGEKRSTVALSGAAFAGLSRPSGPKGLNPQPPSSISSGFSRPSTSDGFEQDGVVVVSSHDTTTEAMSTKAERLGAALYGTTDGGLKMDRGPLRATGLWSVNEVTNEESKTIDFRRIDEVESDIMEAIEGRDDALVEYADEDKWKHKMMFRHKFNKTPKHLTWKELGQEIECLDFSVELDKHRPEERFTINFYFTNRKEGVRDLVWTANNDVSQSEGFTDLLAAVGSCLGRADVFRTVRFDDGRGTTRELTIRKKSRFTSDIQISFRPAQTYNVYDRKEAVDSEESAALENGMSGWGFHPTLMDSEYQDLDDPEGTYTLSISAHALSFVLLRGIERLLSKPLQNFYRPSQVATRAKIKTNEHVGMSQAMKGWLGVDEQVFPHFTPIEAVQEHWLGNDAPFSLVSIINKLREMTYLKKKNPEFHSWLGVRKHDTALAIRNVSVKMLGAGASTLFLPRTHNASVNRLLPKQDQRRIEATFSINAALGMPDETRRIGEFKTLTGNYKLSGAADNSGPEEGGGLASVQREGPSATSSEAPRM